MSTGGYKYLQTTPPLVSLRTVATGAPGDPRCVVLFHIRRTQGPALHPFAQYSNTNTQY